jgi:hypothetical protein
MNFMEEQDKEHTKEEELTHNKTYCCKCGDSFNKKYYFEAHQQICKICNPPAIIDNKNYCCCGKGFSKLNYYNEHQKVCKLYNKRKEQYKTFEKYMKKNMNDIETINSVPKVVFICWFGTMDDPFPKMSENRFSVFQSLVANIGVPVILITQTNINHFIKEGYPLHKSFQYLSGVHKSDYIRCYLLYHYGGGYHDVKHRIETWKDCWDTNNWTKNNKLWMYGRREKNPEAIAYPPGMQKVQSQYKKMVTMGWIICKARTPFLAQLLTNIEQILEKHYNNLVKYPAKNPTGYYSNAPLELVPNNSYPIRWLEILGEIFHPLMITHCNHIQYGLPDAIKTKRYK